MEEFVPLPKAAEELGLTPDALKQVIAKRDIAAFLDGGTFKIRRSELDRYKQRRQSEETVVLPAEEVLEVEEADGEIAEAVLVEEVGEADAPAPVAAEPVEPTLEAIEETAETVDTEITLDELDTVQHEQSHPTPAPTAALEDVTAIDLASDGEATQELAVNDDLTFSDEVGEDEGKTVSLESGGKATTQPLEVGQDEGGDLEEPSGMDDGLEARVHVLEARSQGSPLFGAVIVLTAMTLVYVGMTLWGFSLDYVPSYLAWINK